MCGGGGGGGEKQNVACHSFKIKMSKYVLWKNKFLRIIHFFGVLFGVISKNGKQNYELYQFLLVNGTGNI